MLKEIMMFVGGVYFGVLMVTPFVVLMMIFAMVKMFKRIEMLERDKR